MAEAHRIEQCSGCGQDFPRAQLDALGFCEDPACQEMETESLSWDREYYPDRYRQSMENVRRFYCGV